MNSLQMLAASDNAAGGAILSLLLFVGALIVAIVWICFPFVVNSKMNELIREIRALRLDVRTAATDAAKRDARARGEGPVLPPPPPASSDRPDSAKVYRID